MMAILLSLVFDIMSLKGFRDLHMEDVKLDWRYKCGDY